MTYKPNPSFRQEAGSAFLPFFLALRPHHWTKNFIVFAAPLFNFDFSLSILLNSLLAFCLFCGLSSSFYLFNDIIDVESDRRHPVKCNRPIASGAVPVAVAFCMAIALMVGTLFVGLMSSPLLGLTLVSYAVLQVAYNFRLKRLVLLDIITISTGFVLRACAGAAATSIDLSAWFLVCTAMLALFLAIEKRKAELRRGGSTRSVLKRYSLSLLLRLENIATTGTLMSYALWSVGSGLGGATTPWMLLTFPFVLYGVFRYQLLSDPVEVWQTSPGEPASIEHTERPEKVLLTDRPLLLTVACWGMTALTILWLQRQGLIQ